MSQTDQIETKAGNRQSLHQHVTETIIQQLENGTIPWQKPWSGSDNSPFALPYNLTTGKQYQGINILLLWSSSLQHNFDTSEWASFKQWQQKGECVNKGEKGTMIVYYDTVEREEEGETKKIPFLKSSYVFNRSQLKNYEPQHKPREPFENSIEAIEDFITNTGAIVENEDYGACYVGATDKIYMPYPSCFIDTETRTKEEGYYSVLMHEMTHWTGHPARLNRKMGRVFGNETYAMEELVAEIGAAFLCAELHITNDTRQDHASYIAHWLKILKDNKQHIIKSASEASKAVGYLQKLQPSKITSP